MKQALEILFKHIDHHSNNKYQNSIIDMTGALKEPKFTLLTAEKYLARYLAKSGEKTANVEDLLKACHFILFEIQNRLDNNGDSK